MTRTLHRTPPPPPPPTDLTADTTYRQRQSLSWLGTLMVMGAGFLAGALFILVTQVLT